MVSDVLAVGISGVVMFSGSVSSVDRIMSIRFEFCCLCL